MLDIPYRLISLIKLDLIRGFESFSVIVYKTKAASIMRKTPKAKNPIVKKIQRFITSHCLGTIDILFNTKNNNSFLKSNTSP